MIRLRTQYVRAISRLPRPARLLWIVLAFLGLYGVLFGLDGMGALGLLVLPSVAAEVDLGFQTLRFRSVRFPDAALATGMLVALVLPPTVPLLQAGAVTVAAIALRHTLRVGPRPVFNPAASAVLLGALLFGMAPAWWGAISLSLVLAIGILVTLRTAGSWRLPAGFLAAYVGFSLPRNAFLGGAITPQLLLLGALDPAILFFTFFMVAEPRSSPIVSMDRLFFAVAVGMASALLPAVTPTLAPLVALLLGNVLALVLRRVSEAEVPAAKATRRRATRRAAPRRRPRKVPTPGVVADRSWSVGYRIAAGLAIFAVLGAVAVAVNPPSATPFTAFQPGAPAPAGTVSASGNCSADNPSLSPSLVNVLHQRLGPSVILSANSNTGTVVFYDPVNHVTVTETDLYEDFGFAEFNGDDYAVAGCAP